MAALRITELSKTFGDLTAVDGVTFDVHAGECIGLLGPNGAGKSTTIAMIMGIIGGLLPALRATRISALAALRA